MKTKDGGPAFHSITCKGGDNFAPPNYTYHEGMSLRDYFAGQAMVGWLSSWTTDSSPQFFEADHVAATAYDYADAMLKAREVKP
jgi:hypothetical protein